MIVMNVASKLFNTNYLNYSYLLGKFTVIYVYRNYVCQQEVCICVLFTVY